MDIYDYKCKLVGQTIELTAFLFVDRGRRIQKGTKSFPGVAFPTIQTDIKDEIETNPSLS